MSNIPKQNNDSNQPVKEFFNNYFNETIAFPSNDVDAVVSFFVSKGFEKSAAISTGTLILNQAKAEGRPVFEIIETLKNLDKVKLNELVSAILNTNRNKISILGFRQTPSNTSLEERNIVD